MDHRFVFSAAHHLLHFARVADVGFDHLGVAVEAADICPLDGRIVKIVKIVQRGDGVAIPQEPSNDMGTDEPRATGDKNLHRVRLIGPRKRRQGISALD